MRWWALGKAWSSSTSVSLVSGECECCWGGTIRAVETWSVATSQAWPLLLRLCAPCDPGHWSQSWSQSLVLPGPPSHPVTRGAASTRYQTLSHCTDTTHWPSSWPCSVTSWGTSRCPMASRASRASNCEQASGLETWVHHMLVGSQLTHQNKRKFDSDNSSLLNFIGLVAKVDWRNKDNKGNYLIHNRAIMRPGLTEYLGWGWHFYYSRPRPLTREHIHSISTLKCASVWQLCFSDNIWPICEK